MAETDELAESLSRRSAEGDSQWRPGTSDGGGKSGGPGKVCILSIDGGGMRGIIPGRILAQLEGMLKAKSGDPDARIADFFDLAAGCSVGGIITTMLFTDDGAGRPLFTGEDSWKLIAEKGAKIFCIPPRQRVFKKLRGILTPRYSTKYLESLLKQYLVRGGRELTLRDTLKPVLVPCYDLETAGAFVFSRSDAMEAAAWDFPLWQVCRATAAVPAFFKPAPLSSVDGKTTCTAVDGGLVMNNPTAAAITHVLHNEREYPLVEGVKDMLVLSLGTGQFDKMYSFKKVRRWGAFQWAKPIARIIFDGISDMVDHTVSMAFGERHRGQYVRIQISGLPDSALMEMDDGGPSNVKRLMKLADDVFVQKGMEHLPFGGRRTMSVTNTERLEWLADKLVEEHRARAFRSNSIVDIKRGLSKGP